MNKGDDIQKLFIVPDGGMANRMRAIASGIFLASETARKPVIVWHKDKLCNVDPDHIFDTGALDADILTPSAPVFNLIYNQARKKNLYLPAVVQAFSFGKVMTDANSLNGLLEDSPEVKRITESTDGDMLFFSGQEFYDFPRELYRRIFVFTKEVENRASAILNGIALPETAFQIRRTDHVRAIADSPTEKFISKMKETDGRFFLATDSQEIKERVKDEFGEQAIFNTTVARRDTPEGIVDAMAEILIMSQTSVIYGSRHSSFCEAANIIGNNRLIIL